MRGHSNQLPVDPQTDGGKLQAARLEKDLSLRDIGYNHGYLSRIEHDWLPATPEVVAAYEKAVGHSIVGIVLSEGRRQSPKRQKNRFTRQQLLPKAQKALA